MILAGGQAYTIQGNYAVPSAPDVSTVPFVPQPPPPGGPTAHFMAGPLSPLLAPVPASTAPSPGPHPGIGLQPGTGPPTGHIGHIQMATPAHGHISDHMKNGHIMQHHPLQLQDVSHVTCINPPQ